jgi:hypothetical protein
MARGWRAGRDPCADQVAPVVDGVETNAAASLIGNEGDSEAAEEHQPRELCKRFSLGKITKKIYIDRIGLCIQNNKQEGGVDVQINTTLLFVVLLFLAVVFLVPGYNLLLDIGRNIFILIKFH